MFFLLSFFFFLMIRRPPRSTQSRSSAASDVYKRQLFLEVLRLKGESTTVRITGSSKSALEEIADKIGATQIEVLAEAIEEYRRKVILDTVNESFARLRENEKARKEYEEELGDWDKTLADGLEGY